MSAAESLQVPNAAGVVPPDATLKSEADLVALVAMDATDALAGGQTIRSLARAGGVPPGICDLFDRIGKQMTAEARRVLLAAGKLR